MTVNKINNAFEVEDIESRKNYVFKKLGDSVELWDTSIWLPTPRLMVTFPEEEGFPFDCKNAEEYFAYVYEKSLKLVDGIAFLGFVDDDFEPIEE